MQLIGIKNTNGQHIGVSNQRSVLIGAEMYEGEYEVIPDTSAQTLACQGKRMRDNVRVHPVPYLEKPSDKGGIGIIIGGY